MKESELKKLYLIIDGRTYRPIYEYTAYEYDKNEDEYVYKNLVIIKTAQEVYDECLENKDKIDICPTKTVEERLEEAEQKLVETEQRLTESEEEKKLLKAQVEVLSNTTDFHEELFAEVAMKVYA